MGDGWMAKTGSERETDEQMHKERDREQKTKADRGTERLAERGRERQTYKDRQTDSKKGRGKTETMEQKKRLSGDRYGSREKK